MRRIVVDEVRYVWKREHKHDDGCVEVLTVIVEKGQSDGGARLCLRFREHDGWVPGDYASGVLEDHSMNPRVNLNRPAVVAALVRVARERGWIADENRVEVENPYDWLEGVPRENVP